MEWSKLLCSDRIRPTGSRAGSRDLRTEFEKDYHRIVGSASFRRLQDKTQVFPLDKSDFIRTRLTHSMEVSSFAKSLGQNVAKRIETDLHDPDFLPQYQADICDILQCAGLLHDIGNPPFGHFGETIIRQWFEKNLPTLKFKGRSIEECLSEQMKADFYNFEGNTQALRIITKLHILVDEHGMNLTKALLGTIIKYPVSSLEINPKSGDIKTKKMGYFYADQATFDDIQSSLGTNGARHPLSFLLEAADDIAYRTADIEDAFKKGCISYFQLKEELELAGRENAASELYTKMVEQLKYYYEKGTKNKLENPEAYAIQNWVVAVQGALIYAVTDSFIEHYQEIMAGTYKQELFAGTEAELLAHVLGDVAYRYAFISTPILKIEIAAENIMSFLLDKFVDAIIYYDTDVKLTAIQQKWVALISENYKTVYKLAGQSKSEEEKLYLRLLLATDFVCGMTDSYAQSLYQEMNGSTKIG